MAHASQSFLSNRLFSAVAILALCAPFFGCERLNRELEAVKVVLTGGQSPLKPKSGPEAVKVANAELLEEIFRVVLLRPPQDQNEFGTFWDALNQGASLEGVYNGFVHSSIYRRKEEKTTPATPGAIRTFAKLAIELNSALVAPMVFDESQSKPLETIQPLSLSDADAPGAPAPKILQYGKPTTPISPSASPGVQGAQGVEEITSLFRNATLFTLKRVAGDLALKVVFEQKARGELPKWYGQFASQMTAKKVDFGLELRNKSDEAFHAGWARSSSEDRLIWEVLNRVHRVLNAAEGTR